MNIKRRPPPGDVRRAVSMGQNLRGVITNKNGHTVQFESFAERTLLLLFERDRTVLDYRSQPETFAFTALGGKLRRYTPDFMVRRADGSTEIHEVTRTERQERLCMRERETAAEMICRSRNWKYFVHTEQTLPRPTEVANLMALLRYRLKAYAHDAATEAVRERLGRNAPALLRECMEYVAFRLSLPEPVVFATLCHLLWHEDICADLKKLLVIDSAFALSAMTWLASKEEK